MFKSYAIAVGRGEHRRRLDQEAASAGLPLRIGTDELLLVGQANVTSLSSGDALLVGQAFDRAGEPLTSLPAELTSFDQPDLGPFIERNWGNYALFAASADRALVYRDPSGSVPVYRLGGDQQSILVSDAQIALRLDLLRPQIDPIFLVHWLQFPFLRTARSGLEGVTELLPGMSIARSRSGGWTEIPGWHPARFTMPGRAIEDPAEAARRLRDTALSVIAAQPRGANLILRLSGGLDSSIIAACLAERGFRFECINFATRARDGDERDYARDVASKFKLRLVEVSEPEEAGLQAARRRSFRPLINPLLEPFERAVLKATQELGGAVVIDGAGGDNLFCSITSAAPVIDALANGSPGKAARAAFDIAARANCTIWDVLSAALRRAARRRIIWKEDRSFLRVDAMLPACEPHPWLNGLSVPPGKREHIEALVHIQHFLDRSPSSVPSLRPLLAQPLLELCLLIPSWLWVHGGRDRAIAREAFEGLVPCSVLQRRIKGSLQSLLYRSFERLRPDMRQLLFDGELAHSNIIDTIAVDRALSKEEWKTDSTQLRISEMVALELWLRSWNSQPASSSTSF